MFGTFLVWRGLKLPSDALAALKLPSQMVTLARTIRITRMAIRQVRRTHPVERERQRPTDIAASFAHRHVYVSRSAGRKERRKEGKKEGREKAFSRKAG